MMRKPKAGMRRGDVTVEQLAELTEPHPIGDIDGIPISSLVNSPRGDLPEVLEPIAFELPPLKPTQVELF
jgi:hypothetical protein